ncbi:hypothetical protein RHO14_09020 [Orbus wheelerorum]|uniref:hypothetical protein n=1 Tax=Orbus wheelerorum TaxID=3074111 RepID=UPI00370D1897
MTELIEEKYLMKELNDKSRSSLWTLRTKKGFPNPVLKYPSRYSKSAVSKWLEDGGVNQNS